MTINVIPFDQPAGNFLLAALPATDILRISRVDPRKYDSITMETMGGIQREPSKIRIRDIAEYANSADATFPTPILLALEEGSYNINNSVLEINGDKIADVVDGQHRILGLELSNMANQFVIPVVFILDATEEQKALLFATINGKQTKVPASLIYDLFGITKGRSPQKSAHEIARALNGTKDSPWYGRLKMLGKKTLGSNETLSQGTFINFLLTHISSDPVKDLDIIKKGQVPPPRNKCVFNEYWRNDQDSTILKILMNLFQGAKDSWPNEWENPSISILTKTTGFTGIMRALPEIIKKGKDTGDLSYTYFRKIFEAVRNEMATRNIPLSSQHFSASASGEAEFRDLILNELSKL